MRVFVWVVELVSGVVWVWDVFCFLFLFWLWDGVLVFAVAAGGLVVVVSMGSVAIFGGLFWFSLTWML